MSAARMLRAVLCIAIIGLVFLDPAFPQEQGNLASPINGVPANARYAPMELIVKFKPGVKQSLVEAISMYYGTWTFDHSPLAGFDRMLILGHETVEEMVERFRHLEEVEYAEPNYIAHAHWTPNDDYYPAQWHLYNSTYGGINIEAAWDISTGSGVVVAVVDTGVAYETYTKRPKRYYQAPDLAQTIFVPGYDFVENDTHPNDDNSHGTHVAGTIAQSTNNGIGVAGVAFNCSIMPVKVLDKNGSGYYSWIANGIRWAADHGAKVINMSLGGPSGSTTLRDAVQYAYGKGVTVIASSGNEGPNTVNYPAAYDDYVIAVGATRYDEAVAPYSSYYSTTTDPVIKQYVDLTAPGGDLTVDQNGDGYLDGVLQNTFNPNTKNTSDFGYWFFDGTSMAAPHVSGVAALVIASGVASAPADVRGALESTAEDKGDSGWDAQYGWGIVDAYAALNSAPSNSPPIADAGSDQTVTDFDGNGSEMVTLDGSGSSDSDGTIVSYVWSEGEVVLGTEESLSVGLEVGIHTITLTVTDDDGAADTDEVVISVNSASPSPTTMHVGDLDASKSLKGKSGKWQVLVTVTVHDENHNPLADATVSASWSGAKTGGVSGLTGADGTATFDTGNMNSGTSVTFTVTSVTHATLTYNLADNHDPDGGDSDGTTITVGK